MEKIRWSSGNSKLQPWIRWKVVTVEITGSCKYGNSNDSTDENSNYHHHQKMQRQWGWSQPCACRRPAKECCAVQCRQSAAEEVSHLDQHQISPPQPKEINGIYTLANYGDNPPRVLQPVRCCRFMTVATLLLLVCATRHEQSMVLQT